MTCTTPSVSICYWRLINMYKLINNRIPCQPAPFPNITRWSKSELKHLLCKFAACFHLLPHMKRTHLTLAPDRLGWVCGCVDLVLAWRSHFHLGHSCPGWGVEGAWGMWPQNVKQFSFGLIFLPQCASSQIEWGKLEPKKSFTNC